MDVKIYCFKYKLKTLTDNVKCVVTKNNRSMINGACLIFEMRKNQFVKNGSITGIYRIIYEIMNPLISFKNFRMHDPE